jgi:GNAT superfamily N-acetyltransferase
MSRASVMRASAVRVRAIRRADVRRVWEMVGELAVFEKLTAMRTGSAARLARALFARQPLLSGLVAVRGRRLVGYALFHPTYSSFRTNPRLWLEDLYVSPDARGSGTGEALMRAFVAAALAAGCHRVDWEVLDWNPARRFYERLGATASADGFLKYGLNARAMRRVLARGASKSAVAKRGPRPATRGPAARRAARRAAVAAARRRAPAPRRNRRHARRAG